MLLYDPCDVTRRAAASNFAAGLVSGHGIAGNTATWAAPVHVDFEAFQLRLERRHSLGISGHAF